MKKDLAYVCNYYKLLVIQQTPDDFAVTERFRHGLTDEEIRKGMTAYREFLHALFDKIAENKDKIDVKRGSRYDPNGSKGDRGTSSIKDCYPVFFDIAMILLTLGFHGRLETKPEMRLMIRGEDIFTVICPKTERYQSLIKMSGERKVEMFHLLSDVGLRFDGADFSKEVDFSKTGIFHITSNRNDFFAVGLKLIAEATVHNKYYIKLENLLNPVILRGDFHPLTNEKPKKYKLDILEYVNAQQPEIREWIIKAHTLLMENGCIDMGSGVPFTYVKKNTNVSYGLVCVIDMGIRGCFITPGVNHLANPDSVIHMLPDHMVDMLKSGRDGERFDPEQCCRHSGNMPFARFTFTHNGKEYKGCRHAGLRCQFSGAKCCFSGFRFDLADAVVREVMMRWVEMELTYK